MSLRCSFDLDGTLVEFYDHYINRFGQPKSDLDITKHVMGVLRKDKDFWLTQPVINYPGLTPFCYTTARVIRKQWIKEQIRVNNFPDAPVYQVFGVKLSKYPQLKRSGANLHIDDSFSVFVDLNKRGFPTLLLDSPSNRDIDFPFGRIYSLDKDEIEDTYYLFIKTIFPYFKELIC